MLWLLTGEIGEQRNTTATFLLMRLLIITGYTLMFMTPYLCNKWILKAQYIHASDVFEKYDKDFMSKG